MSRPNPAILLAILLIFAAILAGLGVAKGAMFVGKHEGDTFHMMEIVFRMAAGEVAHRDFMTPIGFMAFAPVAWMVQLGNGIGLSFILAQATMAAVFLPAIWWVGISRLSMPLAILFGLATLTLALALVHGETAQVVSVSMHYNRWAWVAGFLAITLALLDPIHRKSVVLDGIIIGACMALLVLIKVTYVLGFALPVIVALLARKDVRVLGLSLALCVALMGLVTLFYGASFWFLYAQDLLAVAGSNTRAQPSAELTQVIGSPQYVIGSVVAVAAVILLRQADRHVGGLVLLLLLPGFIYVTYQNYANDPQWLMLLAVLLFALRPEAGTLNTFGWDLRTAVGGLALVALALTAPSYINMAHSPLRNFTSDPAEFTPLLARSERHNDIFSNVERSLRAYVKVPIDGEGRLLEPFADPELRGDPVVFMGVEIADCTLEQGLAMRFEGITQDLENAGFSGSRVFAADLFSSVWLFGDFEPLVNGSPWYYGGLPGYESADLLLVPVCPVVKTVQTQILEAITAAGTDTLTEVHRNDVYTLYSTR